MMKDGRFFNHGIAFYVPELYTMACRRMAKTYIVLEIHEGRIKVTYSTVSPVGLKDK